MRIICRAFKIMDFPVNFHFKAKCKNWWLFFKGYSLCLKNKVHKGKMQETWARATICQVVSKFKLYYLRLPRLKITISLGPNRFTRKYSTLDEWIARSPLCRSIMFKVDPRCLNQHSFLVAKHQTTVTYCFAQKGYNNVSLIDSLAVSYTVSPHGLCATLETVCSYSPAQNKKKEAKIICEQS